MNSTISSVGRARGEHLGDAELLELLDVVGRDRAPDRDDDVAGVLLAQQVDTRGTRVMWAPERIERPTASASSWITVAAICSGVWCRPV